jgi:hypothetical protein
MKYPFDLFISYRQSTEGSFVLEDLVPKLDRAGLRTFVDVREFALGKALIDEMARGVESSQFTLVIATPSYLESTFTEFENILAQHLGLEQATTRLIVAERERCELPLRMRAFLYLDWATSDAYNAELGRLIAEVRKGREYGSC